MKEIFNSLFLKYGFLTLFGSALAIIIIWVFAHFISAPGGKVSVVWGMVEYTKSKRLDLDQCNRNISITRKHPISATRQNTKPKSKLSEITLEIIEDANIDNNRKLEKLRKKGFLRRLTTFESGKLVASIPSNTFFYIHGNGLTNYSRDFSSHIKSKWASKYSQSSAPYVEFHYLKKNRISLIGYTTKSNVARITVLTGKKTKKVVIACKASKRFTSLVKLPIERIISVKSRYIDIDQDKTEVVLDVELR